MVESYRNDTGHYHVPHPRKKITLIHSLHVEALPYGTSAQSGQGYNRKLKYFLFIFQ